MRLEFPFAVPECGHFYIAEAGAKSLAAVLVPAIFRVLSLAGLPPLGYVFSCYEVYTILGLDSYQSPTCMVFLYLHILCLVRQPILLRI